MFRRLVGPLTAKHGPLGVFVEFPVLLQLGLICTCAEMAWATLLLVMEFYFKEELLVGQTGQFIASKVAFTFLAFAGAETLFKYPMGALADKFGPRRFVLLALGICVLTPLGMVAVGRLMPGAWWAFIPFRILDGFSAAALWPAMSALMSRSVPKEAKAAAMSVFNAAYCLGLAVGPMLGLYLGHKIGNLWVFPFCSLVMMAGFLIALKSVPHMKRGEIHGENLSEERALLRGRPMLIRMMALYALSQVGVGILAPTVPVYIDSQFGLKQADLPALIALPALAIVAIAIPLGRLADYIGRAKAVWISYGMAASGMAFIAFTSRFEPVRDNLFAPSVIMFGLGMLLMIGSYILGTPAWLGLTCLQVEDKRQAQALSLMQAAQGCGVVVAFALVASAGHLMTTARQFSAQTSSKLGNAFINSKAMAAMNSKALAGDDIPISVWFWIAAAIFCMVLIGTLFWVREPAHTPEAEEEAEAAKQPLEIRGM